MIVKLGELWIEFQNKPQENKTYFMTIKEDTPPWGISWGGFQGRMKERF